MFDEIIKCRNFLVSSQVFFSVIGYGTWYLCTGMYIPYIIIQYSEGMVPIPIRQFAILVNAKRGCPQMTRVHSANCVLVKFVRLADLPQF
jgi:hypothetical protein